MMRTRQPSTIPGHDGNLSHAQMPFHTQAAINPYARSRAPSTHLVGQRHRASSHTLSIHPTTRHQTMTKPSAPAYPPSSPPPLRCEASPSPGNPAHNVQAHPAWIPPPSAWSPNPSLSATSPKNPPSHPPPPAQQAAVPRRNPSVKTREAAARTDTPQRRHGERALSSRTLVPRCLPGWSAPASWSS
jgi:hypothetical protein